MSGARVIDIPIDAYHADTSAISHSGLDEVRDDPSYYYLKRIAKSLPSEDDAEYFEFGRKLHQAVLAPGSLGSGAMLIPPDVLNAQGHRKGAAWKEFAERNRQYVLVKADDPLWLMIQSAKRNPKAVALIEADGDAEHTVYWTDDEFGVDRRARFDLLWLDREIAVDLKSTNGGMTPRELSQTCWNFGYHRQAAFYQDAAEALYGVRPRFVFVFFSKKPPYRVETFELDDEFLDMGREQNASALKTYAACLASGKWLPDTHGKILKLKPPGYARFDKEWSFSNGDRQ